MQGEADSEHRNKPSVTITPHTDTYKISNRWKQEKVEDLQPFGTKLL
jgi:hypothetical protein